MSYCVVCSIDWLIGLRYPSRWMKIHSTLFFFTFFVFLQVFAAASLYIGALLLGILGAFVSDRKQRRAFRQARISIAMKLVLEQQAQEQVRIFFFFSKKFFLFFSENFFVSVFSEWIFSFSKKIFFRKFFFHCRNDCFWRYSPSISPRKSGRISALWCTASSRRCTWRATKMSAFSLRTLSDLQRWWVLTVHYIFHSFFSIFCQIFHFMPSKECKVVRDMKWSGNFSEGARCENSQPLWHTHETQSHCAFS